MAMVEIALKDLQDRYHTTPSDDEAYVKERETCRRLVARIRDSYEARCNLTIGAFVKNTTVPDLLLVKKAMNSLDPPDEISSFSDCNIVQLALRARLGGNDYTWFGPSIDTTSEDE